MGTLTVVKKVPNAVLYDNGMIRVDNVIGSYPHLLKPQESDEGGVPKYSMQGLLPKTTHKEAIQLVIEQVKKMMKQNNVEIASSKLFIKDGDKWYEGKEECKGRYVITAREERRPTIRDGKAQKLDPKDDAGTIGDLFYGGATISMLINPWYQNNKFGKRINANLRSVLFVKHGEAFGQTRIDDEEIWDDVEGEEDDEFAMDDDEI